MRSDLCPHNIRDLAKRLGIPRKRQAHGLDQLPGVYQLADECYILGKLSQYALVRHLARALMRVQTRPGIESAFIAAVALDDAKKVWGLDLSIPEAGIPATEPDAAIPASVQKQGLE